MSEGESFLARWSRLKREGAAAPSRDDDAQAPEHAAPPVDAPPPAVDLASLPPIDSIGPGGDVSAYLTAGVPLELTQAALRSAWRTDPAVRDFVEIADNQWDFNTPEAIPGFGALGATEEAKALVARATTGIMENTATTLASLQPGNDGPDSQVMTGVPLEYSSVADPVWQAGTMPVAKVEPVLAETPEERLEPDAPTLSRRLHGSALPK
jgi:hypothetical protein